MKLGQAEFDRLALEQLDTVYRVARRLTRDVNRAEDLVQDTYLRAIRSREGFDLQTHGIRPWLLRILYNLYLTRLERDRRQPVAMEDEHLEQVDTKIDPVPPLDPQSWEGMDDRLVRALESLPEDYQNVLTLWAVEELSYKEIAETLEIPIGTVMSRLHRARQKLSELLRDYAAEQRIIRE